MGIRSAASSRPPRVGLGGSDSTSVPVEQAVLKPSSPRRMRTTPPERGVPPVECHRVDSMCCVPLSRRSSPPFTFSFAFLFPRRSSPPFHFSRRRLKSRFILFRSSAQDSFPSRKPVVCAHKDRVGSAVMGVRLRAAARTRMRCRLAHPIAATAPPPLPVPRDHHARAWNKRQTTPPAAGANLAQQPPIPHTTPGFHVHPDRPSNRTARPAPRSAFTTASHRRFESSAPHRIHRTP